MLRKLLQPFKYLFVFSIIAIATIFIAACSSFGKLPDLDDEAVAGPIKASPQWDGAHFKNKLAQQPVDGWKAMKSMFLDQNPDVEPSPRLEIAATDTDIFSKEPESGLRVTWLGHSILLLEVDGQNVLIDPVWSERASPFSFLGSKRFYPSPLALEDLPDIDAVLISHDHYDHLDMATVKQLKEKGLQWYVPLGVGSHLRYWGVAPDDIHEMDWWDDQQVGDLKITSIPSRHSSGRTASRSDHKLTLWSGWAIAGPKSSVVYSGDTAMHEDFLEVGKRLGPFDLSIVEIGAYNPLWRDNHLGPEQGLIAHQMLNAKTMLPVHWAGFNLSRHSWVEPIERLLQAAEKKGLSQEIIIPIPGQPFEPATPVQERWWPKVPWKGVDSYTVWSTKVDELLKPYR